ncbi:protein phosphatase 1 regulatory subunit 37-like isoform X2 [Gigantopelta aegis]|uniref:protein phosphatase 1 regulatory subunit 37-like isoform X2 n=1 Tax=Gigantopelta aegis TaxID=1735272 RepID=UPI001B88C819|nr:protein phosphatase 1 regulatory subunit 37-like isoform X2 [Gigantopelta aegis]
MTMTEPSCQSTDCKVEDKSSNEEQLNVNQSETSDVHKQEVANTNSGGGGAGEGAQYIFNGELSDYSNGAKTLRKEDSRGVYFYDSLVTSYLDPPDPWKYVDGWNNDQIAYRYRKSCEKHGTKPLAKLLPQIQDMVNNGKRIEGLNLKGEKLDHKQCECLEEILKCVQFQTIDLEGSHLDDECAVALFDMIEYYDSACQLNISFNKNIGVRGWQACARLIRRTPHLTYLDMRNCDLNERSVPIVGRALKLGSTLTVLHLENTYLSGRSLMIMVAALKMNEILEELFLADNKLMPSDGIQLGTLLKFNHHLQLLDVRNNHLQDVGTSHLSDGLYEQNLSIGLKTLVLWNNGITYQSMAPLGRALSSTETLVTLNLGHNNITNEGIHRIKDGLLKNKSVLRLGLQGIKITCEGAVALAEFIADSPRLLRLDLRENEIKTAGLMALSLAMRVNETVTRMDLDRDTKKESAMKDYAVQQRRLHHEIITYMDRNQRHALQLEAENKAVQESKPEPPSMSVEQTESPAADELDEEAVTYIPSAEKIQRPKLLFSHDATPQQTLESPHDFHQFSHEDIPTSSSADQSLSLHLNAPHVSKPLVTTPPTELLLSPQYVPQLTAKKIFSVSKVSEASVSQGVVSSPLDSVNSAGVSASALCQKMADETINEYIDQIVTADDSGAGGQRKGQTADSDTKRDNVDLLTAACSHTSRDDSECKTELLSDSLKEYNDNAEDVNQLSNNVSDPVPLEANSTTTVQFGDGTDPLKLLHTGVETGIAHGNDTGEMSSLSDISSILCTTSEDEANSLCVVGVDSVSNHDSKEDMKNNGTTEMNTDVLSVIGEKKHGEATSVEVVGVSKTFLSVSNADTYSKENGTGVVSLANNTTKSTDSTKSNSKMDSGIGSYENEQWLKVDSSDLSHQLCSGLESMENQTTEKPNFHTNLSVNGLARELASVLDALDEQVDPSFAGEPPKPVSEKTTEPPEEQS